MSLVNYPQILGKFHDPVVIEEFLYVNPYNYCVELSQIPYEFVGVEVVSPINMREVYDLIDVKEGTYKVKNYNGRTVQFDKVMAGRKIKVRYHGLGIEHLNCESIYTVVSEQGDVLDTLGKQIERGEEAISILDNVGNAYELILRLEQDITNGEALESIIGVADILNESLKVEIPKAESITPRLQTENVEANRILPLMKREVDNGNILLPKLTAKVSEGDTVLTKLTGKVVESNDLLTSLITQNTSAVNNITSLTNKNTQATNLITDLTNKINEGNALKNTIQTSMDSYMKHYKDVVISTFVVNANAYVDKTITCSDVALKDVVNNINFNAFLPVGIRIEFYVSAANIISIRFYNMIAANITVPNIVAHVSVAKAQ